MSDRANEDRTTTILKDAIALLEKHITEARACTNNDFILAWDYSLGVRINDDGSVHATKLTHATAVDPLNLPDPVRNGKGVVARVRSRQGALASDVVETLRLLATLRAKLAERPNDAG